MHLSLFETKHNQRLINVENSFLIAKTMFIYEYIIVKPIVLTSASPILRQ